MGVIVDDRKDGAGGIDDLYASVAAGSAFTPQPAPPASVPVAPAAPQAGGGMQNLLRRLLMRRLLQRRMAGQAQGPTGSAGPPVPTGVPPTGMPGQ